MVAGQKDFFDCFRGGQILLLIQREHLYVWREQTPNWSLMLIGPLFENIALFKFILWRAQVFYHILYISRRPGGTIKWSPMHVLRKTASLKDVHSLVKQFLPQCIQAECASAVFFRYGPLKSINTKKSKHKTKCLLLSRLSIIWHCICLLAMYLLLDTVFRYNCGPSQSVDKLFHLYYFLE